MPIQSICGDSRVSCVIPLLSIFVEGLITPIYKTWKSKWSIKKNIPYIKVVNRKCPQNLQFLLRNGLIAPPCKKKKKLFFGSYLCIVGVLAGGGPVAVGVGDIWHVTGDTRNLTPDTCTWNQFLPLVFFFLLFFFYCIGATIRHTPRDSVSPVCGIFYSVYVLSLLH